MLKLTDDFTNLKKSVEKHLSYTIKNIGVGVSGGVDSIALLYCLIELKKKYNYNLYAIHVNHGIRLDSDEDEKLVQTICKENEILLFSEKVFGLDSLSYSVEFNARVKRYKIFEKAIINFDLDVLMLAQHAGDNAETILMNMFRGCGLNGLIGIKEISKIDRCRLIRPFLAIEKNEIITAVRNSGISYRDDYTNFQNTYTRNYIRLDIIPKIIEKYPNFYKSIYRLSNIVESDDKCLNEIVEKIIDKYLYTNKYNFCFPISEYDKLNKSLKLRLIRKLYLLYVTSLDLLHKYSDDEKSLSYDTSYDILEMLDSNEKGKIEIYKSIYISKSYKYIHFTYNTYTKNFYMNFKLSGDLINFDSFCFKICDKIKPDGILNQSFPLEILDKIVIRYRKSGDYIIPFGMKGKMSLKKYLIDKKIDNEFRNNIPLLAIDNNVLWVCGVGISEILRESKNNNNNIYINIDNLPWARRV